MAKTEKITNQCKKTLEGIGPGRVLPSNTRQIYKTEKHSAYPRVKKCKGESQWSTSTEPISGGGTVAITGARFSERETWTTTIVEDGIWEKMSNAVG